MFCIISAQFLSSWSANLHVLLRSVRVWRTEVSQAWTGLTFTLCSIRTDFIAALTVAHGASWCHCAAFLTSHVRAVGQEFWKQTQEVDKKKIRMDVETRRRSSLNPELFPGKRHQNTQRDPCLCYSGWPAGCSDSVFEVLDWSIGPCPGQFTFSSHSLAVVDFGDWYLIKVHPGVICEKVQKTLPFKMNWQKYDLFIILVKGYVQPAPLFLSFFLTTLCQWVNDRRVSSNAWIQLVD